MKEVVKTEEEGGEVEEPEQTEVEDPDKREDEDDDEKKECKERILEGREVEDMIERCQ